MTSRKVQLNRVNPGVRLNQTTISGKEILNKSYARLNSGSRKSTTVREFSHGVTGHEHYVGAERIPDVNVRVSRQGVTYERQKKRKINGKEIAIIIFLLIFLGPLLLNILGDLVSASISGIIDMLMYM